MDSGVEHEKPEAKLIEAEPIKTELKELAFALEGGNRRALARAVTLIESTKAADREKAEILLSYLQYDMVNAPSFRIGITGPPGAGKSSFIEAIGLRLADQGDKLAVLAVDPSSPVSGGSLLGDKTRMDALSRHPNSFIRPAPSGKTLGGVNRRAREAIWLMEAAGYQKILIETVGVGQGEIAVADICDLVILLLSPAGGDELQGMKKGIVEISDMIIINKADGNLKASAEQAQGEYQAALRLLGKNGRVYTVSSMEGTGIDTILKVIEDASNKVKGDQHFAPKRHKQLSRWFEEEIGYELSQLLNLNDINGKIKQSYQTKIDQLGLIPSLAARDYIRSLIPALDHSSLDIREAVR